MSAPTEGTAPAPATVDTDAPTTTNASASDQISTHVASGKKAIALHQWESAVDEYGEALNLMRDIVPEQDPQMAPLLLSYGKALYELASSQAGVMGREEPKTEAGANEQDDGQGKNPNFVFSGDAPSDDDDDDEREADAQASSSTAPLAAAGVAQPQLEHDPEDIEEPEDDYNAAWEILDVARTIYEKIISDLPEDAAEEEKMEKKGCLADCYLALGNVSCETENFAQAIQDYTSALSSLSHLPPSSRRLASAHYQLATALEFSPSPAHRSDALVHVQAALDGFIARKAELDSVGEGQAQGSEEVKTMSEKEKESEKKDVSALIGDLEAKIEELKAAPPAGDLVSESISHLMGSGSGESAFGPSALADGQAGAGAAEVVTKVNDLTGMVKKKKPKTVPAAAAVPEPESAPIKRSAEDGGSEPASKKAKSDESL